MIFNTRKDYLNIINDVEKQLANQLVSSENNTNPWFILRIQLGFFFHLIYEGKNKLNKDNYVKKNPEVSQHSKLRQIISLAKSAIRIMPEFLKFRKEHKNKKLLVGFHHHNINNKSYNQYLHPFFQDLQNEKILYLDQNPEDKIIDDAVSLIKRYFLISTSDKDDKNITSNAKLVASFLQENYNIKSNYLEDYLITSVKQYNLFLKIYNVLLRLLTPKGVFTYCYYGLQSNALIFSANSKGIMTTEYQHSGISDYHFAYNKQKLSLLIKSHIPQKFFAWEKSDAELFLNNFTTNDFRPEVIISGNKYIEKYKNENHIKNNYSKNILICLQGKWIPEFLEKFILKDEIYNWYFRLHPRYPEDKEILYKFAQENPSINVDDANKFELYDLFSDISIVMTSFSGTAVEAENFEKQVLIFGEDGYDAYKEKIIANQFKFIDSQNSLVQILYNE